MGMMLLSSLFLSCKKANYAPATFLGENQRGREEQEPLLANEMLEYEGLRFSISYAPVAGDFDFKLFKSSPNLTEIKLGVIERSKEYYILSKHLDNNSDYLLVVDYKNVANDGAFQFAVHGILSLKGPAGLQLPKYSYSRESAGAQREFLKFRKGNLKFAFFTL